MYTATLRIHKKLKQVEECSDGEGEDGEQVGVRLLAVILFVAYIFIFKL